MGQGSSSSGAGVNGGAPRSWAEVERRQQAEVRTAFSPIQAQGLAASARPLRSDPPMKKAGNLRVGLSLLQKSLRRTEDGNVAFEVTALVPGTAIFRFVPSSTTGQEDEIKEVGEEDLDEVEVPVSETCTLEQKLNGRLVEIRLRQEQESEWVKEQITRVDAELRVVSQSVISAAGKEYVLRAMFGKSGAEEECVICLTHKKNTTILPCMHVCLCVECAESLSKTNPVCPLCRGRISEFWEVSTSS